MGCPSQKRVESLLSDVEVNVYSVDAGVENIVSEHIVAHLFFNF